MPTPDLARPFRGMRKPFLATAALGTLLMAAPNLAAAMEDLPESATPQGECGPGSRPETDLQGRVPPADHDSGRAAEGYTCNTEIVGHYRPTVSSPDTFGSIGGFKTHRYVDAAGNDCAFFDSTLLFPTNAVDAEIGVTVLDMSDPTNPVKTASLTTPAMLQPHESLVLSQERGILAAVGGTLSTSVGILDLYDVSENCLQPQLLSSSPMGVLGHESGLSPDGLTFWSASTALDYIFAVDISNPLLPQVIYVGDQQSHGITISADGTRTYLAGTDTGVKILDTTKIQDRTVSQQLPGAGPLANDDVPIIASLDWATRSIPQSAEPFTKDGKQYLMEIDEFGAGSKVGAARIIDITDELNPFVVSDMRLEVHQPEHFDELAGDRGQNIPIQGYAGHYCSIPTRVDPEIVACSMIASGLRIFDISDVENPVEVAYFNAPIQDRPAFDAGGFVFEASNWAMSAPAFVPERNEVWFTDAFQGFYAVRLTNGVWNDTSSPAPDPTPSETPAPDPTETTTPAPEPTATESPVTDPSAEPNPETDPLPVTGAAENLRTFGALLLGASLILGRKRRDLAG